MPGKSSSSIEPVLVFTATSSREARSPTAMSHDVFRNPDDARVGLYW